MRTNPHAGNRNRRSLAGRDVAAIGFGCMNASHGYGEALEPSRARHLFGAALDAGYDHFDTAVIYGQTRNESLIGDSLAHRRSEFFLASKCGIFNENGTRIIDSHPERLARACEESLKRLRTERIDLYYLHRWDKTTPVEEVVGGLSRLVEAGKIGAIGLSEVSAATLARAHRTHKIAALQNEYSLWTRNPEIAALQFCAENDIALVAFSPLGRGFLTDTLHANPVFGQADIRRTMPRFQGAAYSANRALLGPLRDEARKLGCTPGQLSLAWLLHSHPHVIPIPGTQSLDHMRENFAAMQIMPAPDVLSRIGAAINQHNVSGARYWHAAQKQVDTETFS